MGCLQVEQALLKFVLGSKKLSDVENRNLKQKFRDAMYHYSSAMDIAGEVCSGGSLGGDGW